MVALPVQTIYIRGSVRRVQIVLQLAAQKKGRTVHIFLFSRTKTFNYQSYMYQRSKAPQDLLGTVGSIQAAVSCSLTAGQLNNARESTCSRLKMGPERVILIPLISGGKETLSRSVLDMASHQYWRGVRCLRRVQPT